MNITLVHAFFGGKAGGGGGIRQMIGLARGLKALGHEVTICAHEYEPATMDPDPADEFEIRSVNTGKIWMPATNAQSMRFSWLQMRDVAKLVPPTNDIVNAHEAPAQFAAYHAKRLKRGRAVWTRNDATLYEMARMPGESWVDQGSALKRGVLLGLRSPDRFAARKMDAITVLDSRNARMVERAYGRQSQIIQSGAAGKFFDAPSRAQAREQLGIPADEFAILAVGILAPYRRHEDLLLALAQLKPHDRATRLRLIGSDHMFPETGILLRGLVAQEGARDMVDLITDPVGDSELVAHFAAADVFVFPNEMQTWGLAPLEAIAAGTPVIVSRGAGVHEVLEGRSGVQVVDPRQPAQIARALERVRKDPSAFDVAATRSWSQGAFSSASFASRMAALFEELG
jgi:glycosyltransferase involved in cell wall biosynthesis